VNIAILGAGAWGTALAASWSSVHSVKLWTRARVDAEALARSRESRYLPGVRVPESALRRSMTGADELVVCDHDVARVRVVEVGSRSAAGVEIAKGLAAGEQIVVDHALGLEDGQPLRH